MAESELEPSPLAEALARVGDRWTLLVVEALLPGPRRFNELLSMIPGLKKLAGAADSEEAKRELIRIQAIIDSMTPKERYNHMIINGSRRRRIAKGSGTTVQEVNQLLKQYAEARKMMKSLSGGFMGKKLGKMKMPPGFPFGG